jgi:adenosylmethionine-8-amino-7-oxononanoate aminotransferase
MTGFGRTGSTWAVEQVGATPDVICSAKGLTSGYLPLGAVISSDRIVAAITEADLPFTHGFTYAGHPVSCEAALANIAIYEREGLAKRSAAIGARFVERFRERNNPYVADLRGRGLMIGLELARDPESRVRFGGEPAIGFAVEAGCFREGVIIGVAPYRDTINLTPPLVLTEAEVDRLVDVLDRVIRIECEKRL